MFCLLTNLIFPHVTQITGNGNIFNFGRLYCIQYYILNTPHIDREKFNNSPCHEFNNQYVMKVYAWSLKHFFVPV